MPLQTVGLRRQASEIGVRDMAMAMAIDILAIVIDGVIRAAPRQIDIAGIVQGK
jgi:hypothetical protein